MGDYTVDDVDQCPWCGLYGPDYAESPAPSDVCHHDPAETFRAMHLTAPPKWLEVPFMIDNGTFATLRVPYGTVRDEIDRLVKEAQRGREPKARYHP